MAKLPGMDQVEGVDVERGAEGDVGQTAIPIYLKKRWARDIPGIRVGSQIGTIQLSAGVDVNLLVDAIRSGIAGEEQPEG